MKFTVSTRGLRELLLDLLIAIRVRDVKLLQEVGFSLCHSSLLLRSYLTYFIDITSTFHINYCLYKFYLFLVHYDLKVSDFISLLFWTPL